MTLSLIILFVLIGLLLIWLEFLIGPCITVAGIGGVILILGGIFFAYTSTGRMTGHIVLFSSLMLLTIMLIISFRSKTWQKTSLETVVDGVVNGIDKAKVKVGDKGTTTTRLAPMGKVIVNGEIIEAKSKLGLVDENEEIVVLDVFSTNVLVEKI